MKRPLRRDGVSALLGEGEEEAAMAWCRAWGCGGVTSAAMRRLPSAEASSSPRRVNGLTLVVLSLLCMCSRADTVQTRAASSLRPARSCVMGMATDSRP